MQNLSTANFSQTTFVKSVANLNAMPPAKGGYEIAFSGRSNVGKSSVINALANQKRLARTSRTPGRTQLINFFRVNDSLHLVDLPGFGYAKVPKAMKEQWQRLLDGYLRQRESLRGLILIMDIRHPGTEFDRQMIDWVSSCQLPTHIVLNKADKLTRGQAMAAQSAVQKLLAGTPPELITIQQFSALKKQGIEQLQQRVNSWLAQWQ